jgi:hypothetical protein
MLRGRKALKSGVAARSRPVSRGRSRGLWTATLTLALTVVLAAPGFGWNREKLDLSLEPPSAVNEVDSDHTVTARLTANGWPLEGEWIHFLVTGANSASGERVTDSGGEADFTYTGTAAGIDTITACLDENHNCLCDTEELTTKAMKEFVPPEAPEQPEAQVFRVIVPAPAPIQVQGEVRQRACPPGQARLVRSRSLLQVKGKGIKRVLFYDDGRRLKTDAQSPFTVNEKSLGLGVNRIRARVIFRGCARPKTLATTVSRGGVLPLRPPFTG